MKQMNLKTVGRLVFSLIALAGGLFAFYEYRKAEKQKAQKVADEKFLHKHIKDLKAFRIKKKGSTLFITQEGKTWVLKQPVQDQASWAEISRWMDEITNQKVQEIKDIDEIKWENWHLSDQAPSVEMDFTDGSRVSFSVSEKSSFDGKYFIRKGEQLFIGERYFHTEVNEKNFEAFRSKSLLPPNSRHATKIQFHGEKGFTLLWNNYKWSLEGADENTLPLDHHRLDSWWTDLSSLKASAIKEKAKPPFLKQYGLVRPDKITFHSNFKEKEYSLKLSLLKNDKAFVALSHRDFILELTKESAELLPLSRHDILNHSFPFDYDKNRAFQIEIKQAKKTVSIKKHDGIWSTTPSDSKKTLDNQKVKDFLSQIKNLKGETYLSSKKAFKPDRSLEIKDEEGQTLFRLEEIAKASQQNSHIKTSVWHEWIVMPKKSIDEIFAFDLVSSPVSKEEPALKEP